MNQPLDFRENPLSELSEDTPMAVLKPVPEVAEDLELIRSKMTKIDCSGGHSLVGVYRPNVTVFSDKKRSEDLVNCLRINLAYKLAAFDGMCHLRAQRLNLPLKGEGNLFSRIVEKEKENQRAEAIKRGLSPDATRGEIKAFDKGRTLIEEPIGPPTEASQRMGRLVVFGVVSEQGPILSPESEAVLQRDGNF